MATAINKLRIDDLTLKYHVLCEEVIFYSRMLKRNRKASLAPVFVGELKRGMVEAQRRSELVRLLIA